LFEANVLGAYYTAGVDNYRNSWSRKVRQVFGDFWPALDRQLFRRKIVTIPDHLIVKHWTWEGLRKLAERLGAGPLAVDWLWEKSELSLDSRCASLISKGLYNAFLGVEHGCLFTIKAAKKTGKKNIVAFLSPHHATREKWVDEEYKKFPELLSSATKRLLEKGKERDRRRDEEANLADVIHTNSRFTTDSLVAAGFDSNKIVTVPLGSPSCVSENELSNGLPSQTKFIYAGQISVGKGAHYLLMAWKKLGVFRGAELHFYGLPHLPKDCLVGLSENVFFHGSVPQTELFSAYHRSSILVFPSLCDGFGMVVLEAMAQGLPVITTPNVGASFFIEEGKNGFLVPPRDEDALVQKLQWCIENPSALREMRQRALMTAQSWTWADYRSSLMQQLQQWLN
jgi:glycosyltransferase involved in cell wall biosynthesis